MKPVFETARFVVYLLDRATGSDTPWLPDVFLAFQPDGEDRVEPLCIVTLSRGEIGGSRIVHWMEVNSGHRRQGIGSEVLLGLQNHVGRLHATAATDDGEAFLEAIQGELRGTVKVYKNKYLKRCGYDDEQRKQIQHDASKAVKRGANLPPLPIPILGSDFSN